MTSKTISRTTSRTSGGIQRTPVSYLVLTLLALFAGLPLLILVFNSFKTSLELGQNPLGLPSGLEFANYVEAWTRGSIGRGMWNSVILVGGTVIGTCVCAGACAYSMARLDLPFKRGMENYLFVVISLPVQMFIVPLFFLWSNLDLIDSLFGLVIIYVALNTPFSVLLLRTFLVGIPRELDEAARIDGANEWQIAWRVILPLARPGLLTVGLVAGLGAYSELLFSVIFVTTPEKLPMATALLQYSQGHTQLFGLVNAAAVIMTLPAVLLFLFMQRKFIAGLASGGVKG
ncbi:carbohydrate ABC transporter permease [Streptosporangium sp. V21-05]|uniref:carbohydrate ABC transporter permease n=1 Tax=Streptosporangium sp. V21-05 TaxID=3446115 RepID=UPI003F52CE7C